MESNYNPPTLVNPQQSNIMSFSNIKKNFSILNGSYSNDFVLMENCEEFNLSIKENQRLRSVLLNNNEKVLLTVLDSAVIYTRTIRLINCRNASVIISDSDVRRIELWDCKDCSINIIVDQVQYENINILIHANNENIKVQSYEYISDYTKLIFKNELINSVIIPKFTDNNKITLVQCTKFPLFSINTFYIKDPFFQEKFEWIKYMTKTVEFHNEDMNKKINGIVTSEELIEAINELKKVPYTLTKEQILAQYDKEKEEYIEPNSSLLPKIKEIAKLLKKK